MQNLRLVLIFSLIFSNFALGGPEYYGAASTEAQLSFKGRVELPASLRTSEVREAVEYQLTHLIGHFQAPSYLENGGLPGVLGDTLELRIGKGQKSGKLQLVEYEFKARVNFHAKAFRHSHTARVNLRLPLNPYTNYKFGLVGGKNRCTDQHYNTEGDYFYFWDPDMPGCPLTGDHPQVLRFQGKLTRIANTQKTWPEYDRLYEKDALKIAVFVGYIDEVVRGRVRTSDDGYRTYRGIKEELLREGFQLQSEKKRFAAGKNSYLTTLTKTMTNALGRRQDIELSLLLADTELHSRTGVFDQYFARALSESDIVAYDGHSGLGGNLHLENLPRVNFRSNYQIYYFNGCSTYAYFNTLFFNAKPGGKKNLEIITSGLPTYSSSAVDNMMAFLDTFIHGKVLTYQTIMQRLERSNADEGTYLMGVNGDEDNRFKNQ